MTRYWVNYRTNSVTTTQNVTMSNPWKEVSKDEYKRVYYKAWMSALNSGIWHC